MSQFLLYYQRPEPTTWVYLSSFLTIGLYFVFHRFWSARNLDIFLLILLAPGILMVHEGRKANELAQTQLQRGTPLAAEGATGTSVPRVAETVPAETLTALQNPLPNEGIGEIAAEPASAADRLEFSGFLWLLSVELAILIRLLIDPMMVRRPLLDPNLTTGGLAFIGVSMLMFLMGNVINSRPQTPGEQGPQLGPGYPVLNMLPAIPTIPESRQAVDANHVDKLSGDLTPAPVEYAAVARTLAILAHLAVVIGITLVGHIHFSNFKAGAGCATLYLMLPYTAQMTGRVDHVLPAALLVWAVLMYRRPLVAGICLGLAAGLVYYPAFLLPLWLGFYRSRGIGRFTIGVVAVVLVLTVLLSLGGSEKFFERLIQMYGLWLPRQENLEGVWSHWQTIWRFPVLVGFALLSGLYAVWPSQKNLGTLISCSAALMVAAQFWHGFGGGLFIGWFLPLLLLTIFRPNLEDRVATKVVGDGPRRTTPDRLEPALS